MKLIFTAALCCLFQHITFADGTLSGEFYVHFPKTEFEISEKRQSRRSQSGETRTVVDNHAEVDNAIFTLYAIKQSTNILKQLFSEKSLLCRCKANVSTVVQKDLPEGSYIFRIKRNGRDKSYFFKEFVFNIKDSEVTELGKILASITNQYGDSIQFKVENPNKL